MKELKICVIGAGSTYSPELIDGFFNRQDKMKVKEFALMDIRMDRLKIVGGLIERMCQHYDNPPKVIMTDDLKTAVEGADYVVLSSAWACCPPEPRTRESACATAISDRKPRAPAVSPKRCAPSL